MSGQTERDVPIAGRSSIDPIEEMLRAAFAHQRSGRADAATEL